MKKYFSLVLLLVLLSLTTVSAKIAKIAQQKAGSGKVIVQSFGQAPPNVARWGMSPFTSSSTTNPSTATRFAQAAGIKISSNQEFMVRGINHSNNLVTTIEVEEII